MNQHVHPISQTVLNGMLCTDEAPEGLDEVMEPWYRKETVVGPCTVDGKTTGSSEDEGGEETVV